MITRILTGVLLSMTALAAFAVDFVPAYQQTDTIKTDPVTLPPYTTTTLSNGLKIYLVEQPKLPIVSMRVIIKAGSLNDPQGQAGITDFTAGLLRKGVKYKGVDLSAPKISQLVDSVGGYVGAGAGYTDIYAGAWGLSKHSDLLLDLLAATVRNPTFPEQEIQRSKMQLISGIIAKRDEPDDIGREVFKKVLYGNHPLAQPVEGDSASVASFTRELVLAQWAKVAIPNNSVIAIVGDFDRQTMLRKLNQLFGDWKKGEVPAAIPAAAPVVKGRNFRIVDKPDAVQTVVRLGHHGIPRNHPDYYPLMVMAQILSNGDFDSRMMKTIRTEKGLTYGIGGRFQAERFAGPYSIGTSTQTGRTEEMLKTIFEIIEEFRRNGPTDDEMMQAKMYMTGSYPLQFETPMDIGEQILDLDLLELPPKTIPEYRMRIAKVTKGDVIRVAGEYLHPDDLFIVLVGNKQEILPQLDSFTKMNSSVESVKY
ncbi:MAG: insulinase family protein [bacterium]|nr:insulinase family protein [bacterium]